MPLTENWRPGAKPVRTCEKVSGTATYHVHTPGRHQPARTASLHTCVSTPSFAPPSTKRHPTMYDLRASVTPLTPATTAAGALTTRAHHAPRLRVPSSLLQQQAPLQIRRRRNSTARTTCAICRHSGNAWWVHRYRRGTCNRALITHPPPTSMLWTHLESKSAGRRTPVNKSWHHHEEKTRHRRTSTTQPQPQIKKRSLTWTPSPAADIARTTNTSCAQVRSRHRSQSITTPECLAASRSLLLDTAPLQPRPVPSARTTIINGRSLHQAAQQHNAMADLVLPKVQRAR